MIYQNIMTVMRFSYLMLIVILGYGGLASLHFELNCANWLGKLFKDNIVKRANIFYSPYTLENQKILKN